MNSRFYPPSPELSNDGFIKPSPEFRKVTASVIFAIILFFLFYLLLIALTILILIAAGWAGITIISVRPGFITLAAGAGIIGFGVMLFVFLFKFIFSRTKVENPFRIEIKEKLQPELFAFIRSLNKDTKTPFPKKIFLSPEVNAMVFYHSSFWSLFFPVRKNLEIGLGLINSLTVSELKAVLAHEFGHFSQRSMKIGSYIYTVNRVIYNLVYEYDSWDIMLSNWAQLGGVFGFFAKVTFWFVERVRDLLKVAYNLINVSYMRLSREMEYHADLVAVSVSGNEAFRNALRKIEFSSFAYDDTINCLNSFASKEKATPNIYANHSFSLSFLARHNQISGPDGKLKITDPDPERNVVKPRVNFKDQWASHPTLKEREENIAKVNIEAEENESPAWILFSQADDVQKEVTKNLYHIGFPDVKFSMLEMEEYQGFVRDEINKYKISEKYNGFYEGRYLSRLELDDLVQLSPTWGFDQLYSNENTEKIKRLEANKADLALLNQIHLNQIPTKYFEFDGQKHKRKEVDKVIQALQQEIEADKQWIVELDKESYIYHFNNAKKQHAENRLLELYKSLFRITDAMYSMDDLIMKLQGLMNTLYSKPRWTEDEIKQLATELSALEKQFKDFLSTQILESIIRHIELDEQKEVLKEYMHSNNYYSKTFDFDEQAMINLSRLIQDVFSSFATQYGNSLKETTDYQLELEK